ncbi:hypothetical protein ABZP36_019215 [Zizania latifolia]
MAALRVPVLVTCALLLAVACQAHPYWPLEMGFYRYKCPQAEAVVKAVVEQDLRQNPGNGAAVIRMLFHDCFVEVRKRYVVCFSGMLRRSAPRKIDLGYGLIICMHSSWQLGL